MATEKIEIEILAKGKPAEKAIKGVEKKTKDLGTTAKKTGKDTDGMLTRMKAGWIAVGAAMAIAINKASTFERASLGLTKGQKEWAKETALATDITADQVAGFLKSAQTAGLAEEQMKELAKQSIALGYAFPHENAETLNDNLIMLAKTGEAQGFVVDILEQKYVGLGEDITTLDLKTKSMAEKLKLVGEVAKKSQAQMDASSFNEYNEAVGRLSNGLTDLGESIMAFLGASGLLSVLNSSLSVLSLGFKGLAQDAKNLKTWLSDDKLARRNFLVSQIEFLEKAQKTLKESGAGWADELDKMFGSDTATKIKDFKKELSGINEELLLLDEEAPLEKRIARLKKLISKLSEKGARFEEFGTKEEQDAVLVFYQNLLATITPLPAVIEQQKTAWDNVKAGVKGYIDKFDEVKELKAVGSKVAKGLEDAFVNMAMGVKTSFKDMARAVIADLIRIQIRKTMVSAMSNIFHTGGEVKHTGGAIGSTRIPSFHTGVRSDERLAKLQVGEAVINRGGAAKNRDAIEAMNKGYSVGGGGNMTQAEINFNVTAIDAASFNNYLVGNKHTIEGIINRSLQTNGTVRQTIKQVV